MKTTIFTASPPISAAESLTTNADIVTQDSTSGDAYETPSNANETLEPTLGNESITPISSSSISLSETTHTLESASTQFPESTQHSQTTSSPNVSSVPTLTATSATTTISTATTLAPDVKKERQEMRFP
jgi:hypothetical protein